MAQVLKAANPNQIEVETFIADEVEKTRQFYEREAEKRPRRVAVAAGILAVCVIAALVLLFVPGLLSGIQDAVKGTLNSWGHKLMTYVPGWDIDNEPFLARIFYGLLGFALMLFLGFIGAVVYLFAWLSPVLTVVVLFGLIVALALYGWLLLTDAMYKFDPDHARERAIDKMDSRLKQLYAGVQGEQKALDAVRGLGDACYIFANLKIKYEGEKNETDLIVVSPSGLTLIEVKNYSGTLIGDLSDYEFTQRKFSKNGQYKDEKRSNPVKQMGAPTYKLAHYLKSHGISVNVRRCALFINDKVEFQLTDRAGLSKTCPLFMLNSTGLLPYLHSEGDTVLTRDQIQRIVTALRPQLNTQ